jgi:response regulator RpfG family c-di-GMP phosphodiesterase
MAFIIHNNSAHNLYIQLLNTPSVAALLGQLLTHHAETHGHCLRVGLLSIDLGLENRLSRSELYTLGTAALLHDIGKLYIPAPLLSKADRLELHEIDLLRSHDELGSSILNRFEPQQIPQVVAAHHAYGNDLLPRRLELVPVTGVTGFQDQRPSDPRTDMLAQIVAAADMFDALSSRRAYKGSYDCSETSRTMQQQYQGNPHFRQQVLTRCCPTGLWN